MGPTSSGKTGMAVELVQRFPFEIINVDSAQVYRGMDIGTGKPDKATLSTAPHRLIDIKDPSEAYSASDFREDAIQEIGNVLTLGKTPLLVGGTMLYFKVLRDGLAAMPHADAEIRSEIETLAKEKGWEEVHQKLAQVDPDSAQRIHPNDPQRLQRALEIYLVSGKTMSQFHAEEQEKKGKEGVALPFNLHYFAIQPEDRDVLHKQIAHRFMQMLEDGLLKEVSILYQREDLHEMLPSIKSVGYRQVWQHLAGELSYDAMVEKSIIATRQLAKRQLTWLRSWENLRSLRDPSGKSIDTVLKYVESTAI
ncbi:MAG: tRNA (adenosine(37)-N6)-dimethylallyltransferase MiaA [Pseudomonadales bacterium]|nr:tRNA (adenosine(37)-N6)-dimethylallyltransferase MiaA [Pseudomonadales bacterium]